MKAESGDVSSIDPASVWRDKLTQQLSILKYLEYHNSEDLLSRGIW